MKKLTSVFFSIILASSFTSSVNAQMMGARLPDGQGFSNSSADWNEVDEHTLREEQEEI